MSYGKYVTIYGEVVEAKIINILKNTVIVEDTKNVRHVVHKNSIATNFKRKQVATLDGKGHFDLAECQTIGNNSPVFRKGRKI